MWSRPDVTISARSGRRGNRARESRRETAPTNRAVKSRLRLTLRNRVPDPVRTTDSGRFSTETYQDSYIYARRTAGHRRPTVARHQLRPSYPRSYTSPARNVSQENSIRTPGVAAPAPVAFPMQNRLTSGESPVEMTTFTPVWARLIPSPVFLSNARLHLGASRIAVRNIRTIIRESNRKYPQTKGLFGTHSNTTSVTNDRYEATTNERRCPARGRPDTGWRR